MPGQTMPARGFAAFVLVLPACSSDAGSEAGQAPTGQTSSTSGAVTRGGSSVSATSGSTETTGEVAGSTSSTVDGETGLDGGSRGGSGSTGGERTGSPGCLAAVGLAEGEHQFMLDGYDRRYIVRLPLNYSTDRAWPLVFALHGNGGNTSYWDTVGGDRDIRTAFGEDAVIIVAEAINNQWRDYDAPAETWPAGIELELNYFDAVLQTAQNELCIDTANVFSMGFSGGGSFSGVLGCRRSYVRAIAVGGSVIYFDADDCVSAPAAWVTIGDGEVTDGRIAFRDFFRGLGGCQPTATPGDPEGCVDYEGCGPGTPATFCAHPARHVWPSIGTAATQAFFAGMYGTR